MNDESAPSLLPRYLNAIGVLLPRAEREDILRELRANLEARLEAVTESTGQPPTEEEVAKVLQEHGHPLVVAARYRPSESLIGPLVWPYFWAGLRVVGLVAAFCAVITAMVNTLSVNDGGAWASFLPRLLFAGAQYGFAFLGLWVLVMALVERGWSRAGRPLAWDPRQLKQAGDESTGQAWVDGLVAGVASLGSLKCDPQGEARGAESLHARIVGECVGGERRDDKHLRGRAFSAFFGGIVNLVATYLLFHYGETILRPGNFNAVAGPVWADHYAVILGIFASQCVVLFPSVVFPQSAALWHLAKALSHLLGAAVVWLFLQHPPLFLTTPLQPGQVDLTRVVAQINEWQYPVLLVGLVVIAGQALYRLGRFVAVVVK